MTDLKSADRLGPENGEAPGRLTVGERRKSVRPSNFADYFLAALLVITVAYGLAFVGEFRSIGNLRVILASAALVGIIAAGLSLMTITGSLFSLSIAPTVAVSTIVFVQALQFGAVAALACSLVFGVLVGAIQGAFIGFYGADPILTTLAAGAIILGLGQLLTGGRTVVGEGSGAIFQRNYVGVPGEVVALILVVVLVDVFQRRFRLGREMRLVGLSPQAAHIASIRVGFVKFLAVTVAGACMGVAGGLLGSRSGQGNLTLGASLGFSAIAAVVIGGISIAGGIGRPLSAAVGAVYVALLGNLLLLSGYTYQVQLTVQGALVLLTVIAPAIIKLVRRGRRR